MASVMFLTSNDNALALYEWLDKREDVFLFHERISVEKVKEVNPDWIVSYNYKYIISQDVIECMNGRILNMHISLLPWNRGADPNFWSFVDDTPKGVTIHQINKGLDKGKIMYQKECQFDETKETFATTYNTLHKTIMELFMDKWEEIKAGNAPLLEQTGTGTYHSVNDMNQIRNRISFDWNDQISDFLKKYRAYK